MTTSSKKTMALVLSGGGARGAYEAGIIHYIRTMLPATIRNRPFDIQCGSSVGAVNACFLASSAHDLNAQGVRLKDIWETLTAEQIYSRHTKALIEFLTKGSRDVLWSFLRGKNTKRERPHFRGFLDTRPFLPFLQSAIDWKRIAENVAVGRPKALCISATNVFTGRLELFIEKRPDVEYTGEYITHFTSIEPIHAMASAAMPVIFPTVAIDGIAYTDGGLRLNTPMSPAIQLGADALFVIGLHHRAHGGKVPSHGTPGKPPSLGQVWGRVMNSIFLDRIQYDIEQLERINRIIDWSEKLYGETYLKDLNRMLDDKGIRGDVANRGLKRIQVFRIRPSEDIGELFSDIFLKIKKRKLSIFEQFMLRLLDVDPNSGVDFLSYIGFIPEYLKALLQLGFDDAAKHRDEIITFLNQ